MQSKSVYISVTFLLSLSPNLLNSSYLPDHLQRDLFRTDSKSMKFKIKPIGDAPSHTDSRKDIFSSAKFSSDDENDSLYNFEELRSIRKAFCELTYKKLRNESVRRDSIYGLSVIETQILNSFCKYLNPENFVEDLKRKIRSATVVYPHIYPYNDKKDFYSLYRQENEGLSYAHHSDDHKYLPVTTKRPPKFVQVYPGAYQPTYAYSKVPRTYWMFTFFQILFTLWELLQTLAILYLFGKLSVLKFFSGREETPAINSGLHSSLLDYFGLRSSTVDGGNLIEEKGRSFSRQRRDIRPQTGDNDVIYREINQISANGEWDKGMKSNGAGASITMGKYYRNVSTNAIHIENFINLLHHSNQDIKRYLNYQVQARLEEQLRWENINLRIFLM